MNDRSKLAKQQSDILSRWGSYFKETDDDLKLNSKLLGMTAYNRYIAHNTSPRGSMMHGHISSAVVLKNPDMKIIQSDIDKELSTSAVVKRFDNDVLVLDVIERYKQGTLDTDAKPTEYVIIYRDIDTDEVSSMSIPVFNRFHIYFGFVYNIDREYIEALSVNDLIPKDKVLAWSNSYDPKTEEYGFGKTINVALVSKDLTGEDGIIITRSGMKMLEHTIIEHRKGSGGDDNVFLNIHGDEDNYRPFPGIGEHVGSESIAFATRKINDYITPILTSIKEMRRVNPIFDVATYSSSPTGKVIDLKVIFNKKRKRQLPDGTEKMFEQYRDAYLTYCRDIVNSYTRINNSYKFSTGNDLVVGYEFNNMLVHAYNILYSSSPLSKIKKLYRKENLDLYTVNMDIQQDMLCGIKNKITSSNGDKGVIVSVIEDEDSYYDSMGNRADIIMDPGSTISRLNIGRLYERYFAASSREAKRLIVKALNDISPDLNKIPDIDILEIHKQYVVEFVKIFGNEQYTNYHKAYVDKDIEGIRDLLSEIVEREFYIYSNIEDDVTTYEAVLLIEQSIFKPPYGPVTFRKDGEVRTTKNNVMIAPMYIYLLNKLADSLLTTSSAKVNHWMLPIGVSKADRYGFPHKNTPLKAIGETEARGYVAYGGRKFLAELLDRGASIKTHSMMYRNILTAEVPTNIKQLVDRKEHPYGTHKALQVINTLFNSVGLGIEYTPDKNRYVKESNESKQLLDIDIAEVIENELSNEEDT